MQTSTLDAEESRLEEDATMMGCGNCTLDTRCECLEKVFNNPGDDVTRNPTLEGSMSNEPTTSMQPQSSTMQSSDFTSLETDYTSRFAAETSKNPATTTAAAEEPPDNNRSNDHCGFCQDGAPCLCAQMDRNDQSSNPHPPPSSISRFTPPPAAGDVCRSSAPAPPRPSQRSNTSNPCANGPGTCTQCQLDPSSTLFCKSLATLPRPSHANNPNTTSSNNTNNPTTTTNNHRRNNDNSRVDEKKESTAYLSCADTYTTLSRHPRFQDAADEIDSWLGKLRTTLPKAEEGRPAMEIEAASVMGVLRFFDRRFGGRE